jgi:enoyl-CoA hydratase
MEFNHLKISRKEAIATVTIDRPKVLNSIDRQAMLELQAAFDALMADSGVRVIIFTGGGEKAFMAGADIHDEVIMDAEDSYKFSRQGHQLAQTIETGPKPVIAAINGFALGGGMELMLACDLRIAADTARFGVPEVTLGTPCGFGGTTRLPRLVGVTKAKEMLLLGGIMDAAEALRCGLVTRVVPGARLMDETMQIAGRLAGFSPFSVTMSKRLVDWSMDAPLGVACQFESAVFFMAGARKAKKEGMQAFIDKREPKFTD